MEQLTSRVVTRDASVIDDILKSVQELRACMDRIELIPPPSGSECSVEAVKLFCKHVKEEALDTMTDMHEKLCQLMVRLLHAPMNRRILAPFPALVVSSEEKLASLKSQMGC